ncbi:hypothetical protein HYH03_006667 [Edaphochlamys debaryana]|uniref:Uncharacterized protein n=1 Tax=Edaphochlamys debaryana TaxID=47281 RepID=A0A836BZR7_9CHLO|nr:hypothetical protein HYH03_006667 [Edaphochlamys debaryana]|eukprot:KAG2495056.1 hypothetical protein HYH03_006667 [Edaphochlamys debaryana]
MLLESPVTLPGWDFLKAVGPQALECCINVDVDGLLVHRSTAIVQDCRVVAGADGLLQRFQGWEVLSWRARPSAGAIDLSLCPPPEPQPRSRQQDAAPLEDARSAHSFLSGGRYPAESSAHRSQPAQPGASSRSAAPETQDLLLSLLGTLPAQRLSPAAAQLLLQSLERRQREEEQEGPPAQLLPPQPKQELHPTAVSYRTGGPPQETEAAAGTAWAGASQQPTALAARVSAYSQPEGSWRRAQEPGGRDVRTRCATDGLEAPGPTPGGLSSLQPPSAHAEQVSASVAALISQLQSSRPAGPPAGGKEQAQQRAPASRVQSYEVPAASDEEPAAPALPSAVPRDGRVPHFSGGAVSLGRPALEAAEHAPAAPVRAASCPEDRSAKPEALGPQAAAAALVGSSISPEDTQDPAVLWEMLRALQRQQDKIQAQLAAAQQSKAGTRDRQGGRSGAGVGPAVQPAAAVQSSAPPSPSAHASIKEEAGAPRGPLELQARLSSEHQDDATDEVVARTPTRPMNRYLTSVEVRVLFSEEQAAALSAPPCGLALTMQVFLDGAPLGPPQGAQVCRYNTSSPRYLTSIPSQEATSPPLPWKRLADTFLHYRRMRSGVLQMHASTRPPGQGDDTTLQLAPAVAAALPPLTLFTPPGLRRLAAAGLAAAAASGQEGGSGFGVCEDGPAEEAWAEATSRQGRAAPRSPSCTARAPKGSTADASGVADVVMQGAGPQAAAPLAARAPHLDMAAGAGNEAEATSDPSSTVLVSCPPRSLSRYLTKSELEVLVGTEVFNCLMDGSKLTDVRVQFEIDGSRLPGVYVADIERYNPSSPFYLKASSGRGVDGLPWRSIPPNATVQWKRMADNTLVLAQVPNPSLRAGPDRVDSGEGSDDAGQRPRGRGRGARAPKRRAVHRSRRSGDSESDTEEDSDPSALAANDSGGGTDEDGNASDESCGRRRKAVPRKRARTSTQKAPRSPPTGTHLLDALAGAAAAAALDRDSEADPKAEAKAGRCRGPEAQTRPARNATIPGPRGSADVPAQGAATSGPDTNDRARATNLAAAGSVPMDGPSGFSGPSSSGFTSRIVATNLYIGRRQLQALYGPDFAAEVKSEMQLHLNGSLQPEVFTVQWKEGCHKGSFYPRGAPLGQLRGRFLQDIRWLDEQANRLAFVAWDTPPADWAGQRRTRGAGANAGVTKIRKWLWQRQAELAAKRGASAAPSSGPAGSSGSGPASSGRASEAEDRAPAATQMQTGPDAHTSAERSPTRASAEPQPFTAELKAEPREAQATAPGVEVGEARQDGPTPALDAIKPERRRAGLRLPSPDHSVLHQPQPQLQPLSSRTLAPDAAAAASGGARAEPGPSSSRPPSPGSSAAGAARPEASGHGAQGAASASSSQPPSPRTLHELQRGAAGQPPTAGLSPSRLQPSAEAAVLRGPAGGPVLDGAVQAALLQLQRALQGSSGPAACRSAAESAGPPDLACLLTQISQHDSRAAMPAGARVERGLQACRALNLGGEREEEEGEEDLAGMGAARPMRTLRPCRPDGHTEHWDGDDADGGVTGRGSPERWLGSLGAPSTAAPAPALGRPAPAPASGVMINTALVEQLRAEARTWRVERAAADASCGALPSYRGADSAPLLRPTQLAGAPSRGAALGGKRSWEELGAEELGTGGAAAQRRRPLAEGVEMLAGHTDARALSWGGEPFGEGADAGGGASLELGRILALLGGGSAGGGLHLAPGAVQAYGTAADLDLDGSAPDQLTSGAASMARRNDGSAASAPPAPGAVDTSRVCVGGDFEPTEHLLIRAMPWLSVHLAQRWYPAALGRSSEDPFPVTVAFEIDGWLLPERYSAQLKSYPTNNGLFLPGLPLRRVRGLLRTGWRRLTDGTLVLQARTPQQQPVAPAAG